MKLLVLSMKALNKLEQSFSFTTPELQWFEQKIAQQKEANSKKMAKRPYFV